MLFLQKEILKIKIMSEKEMKSYRFNVDKEPSDEMLRQLMREVAEEARNSNKKASDEYMLKMRHNAELKKHKWADRINSVM